MIEYTCKRCGAKCGTAAEAEPELCFTCRRDDEWEALGMPLCVDCGVHRVGPKHHAAGGTDCEGCWTEKAFGRTRMSRVHIDAEDHTQVFEARISDGTWNGWMCPTFDLENARRVEAMVTRFDDSYTPVFLWTTDREGRTCLVLGETDGTDWWWEPCGDEESGFPIGAHSWVWSELDEDAPHEPAALDVWLREGQEASERHMQVWNTALHAAYDRGANPLEAVAAAQSAVDDRADFIRFGE